jgi:hypothetical protein
MLNHGFRNHYRGRRNDEDGFLNMDWFYRDRFRDDGFGRSNDARNGSPAVITELVRILVRLPAIDTEHVLHTSRRHTIPQKPSAWELSLL